MKTKKVVLFSEFCIKRIRANQQVGIQKSDALVLQKTLKPAKKIPIPHLKHILQTVIPLLSQIFFRFY